VQKSLHLEVTSKADVLRRLEAIARTQTEMSVHRDLWRKLPSVLEVCLAPDPSRTQTKRYCALGLYEFMVLSHQNAGWESRGDDGLDLMDVSA
jgi:hypothetical protein